jgi:thiosulfate dehydrogenase (quinone) large subunit
MLGLLGIGVALIAGIGLRMSAIATTVMMAGMWLAEFPLDKATAAGQPSGSPNPLVDYHVVYALVAIVGRSPTPDTPGASAASGADCP